MGAAWPEAYPATGHAAPMPDDTDIEADASSAGAKLAEERKASNASSAKDKEDSITVETEHKRQLAVEMSVDYDWVIRNEAKFSDAFLDDIVAQSGMSKQQLSVLAVRQGSTVVYLQIVTSAVYKGEWTAKDWQGYMSANLKSDAFFKVSAHVGKTVTGRIVKA